MQPAVFLDRDGVLIEDVDLLVDPERVRILPGVPQALKRLKENGFLLLVVSNQTVIARGLASEIEVRQVHQLIIEQLKADGAPELDGFYFCPHHPQATVVCYRCDCSCRKPKPGLILQAAHENGVDLAASYMVGDRVTDIIAGERAGCRTVQVRCGRHQDPLIVTSEPIDDQICAGHSCADLAAAVDWIVERE